MQKIDRYIADHPPVETFPRFYLVLLRQPIAPMEADGMSRVYQINPRNVTKPLNICSDFHLGRHFFGLVGGFFVGLSVTLPHEIVQKIEILSKMKTMKLWRNIPAMQNYPFG